MLSVGPTVAVERRHSFGVGDGYNGVRDCCAEAAAAVTCPEDVEGYVDLECQVLVVPVLGDIGVRCLTVGDVNVVPRASTVTGSCILTFTSIVAGGQ